MASWFGMLQNGTVVKSSLCASTSIGGGVGQSVKWGDYEMVNYNGAVGQAQEAYTDAPPAWQISCTVGLAGANAYVLPWGKDKICYTRLNTAHELFCTAAMNGCGVMIAGPRNSPTVVHANSYDVARIKHLAGEEKAAERRRIYDEMLAHLKAQGVVQADADVASWYPGSDYVGQRSGVFGALRAGSWVFYGHANEGNKATTRLIWPLDAVEDEDVSGNRNKCKCCFVTTAVCQSLGLPDDCEPLRTLRWYRDEVLAGSAEGRRDIETYYRIAPELVAAIERRPDARRLYRTLERESIAPAVAAIQAGQMQRAYELYHAMLCRLTRELSRPSPLSVRLDRLSPLAD